MKNESTKIDLQHDFEYDELIIDLYKLYYFIII